MVSFTFKNLISKFVCIQIRIILFKNITTKVKVTLLMYTNSNNM